MRVARAFRLPIIAAMTALALSGCMHASGPVAVAQPQSDLDYMAYGQPYSPAPATAPSYASDGGGAISALAALPPRRALTRRPRRHPVPSSMRRAGADAGRL